MGAIPVVMPRPDTVVSLWGQQLNLLTSQVPQTKAGLEAQGQVEGITPAGTQRLQALANGVMDQVADVVALMGPALPGLRRKATGPTCRRA